MPRVFAKGEGYELTIAGYGRATQDTPAVVPVEVAEELRASGRKDIRIRWDGQDPRRHGQADEDEPETEAVEGVIEDGDFRTADEVPAVTVTEEPAPGARGEE